MTSPSIEEISRSAQAFDEPIYWNSSNFLDSASALWIEPTMEPYIAGHVVVTDLMAEQVLELYDPPLTTAFVKTAPGGPGSVIQLILVDAFNDPFFIDPNIYADPGAQSIFCRYPTVEVSYWRGPVNYEYGVMAVHVIWSQFTGPVNEGSWNLYYMLYIFTVDNVDWRESEPDEIGPTLIPIHIGDETVNELEPDLALMPNGDLLLAFSKNYKLFGSYGADIQAIHGEYAGEYPPDWGDNYDVCANYPGALPYGFRVGPSIDVGEMDNGVGDPYDAFCVWTALNEPNGDYVEVWYCQWDAFGEPALIDVKVLSGSGMFPEFWAALPKVDIVPFSDIPSDYDQQQAVITWTHFDYDDELGVISNPVIMLAVTPNLDEEYFVQIEGEYGIAPDIAAYQRDTSHQERQWFGISYYASEEGGKLGEITWDILKVRSFGYIVDSTELDLESHYFAYVYPKTEMFWAMSQPFTGSTLCLRNPEIEDEYEPPEPFNDWFGLGWIEGTVEDRDVYLTSGTIQ